MADEPLREDHRRKQILLTTAGLCADCKLIFDFSEEPKCPNCDGAHGWMALERIEIRAVRRRNEQVPR